MTDEAAYDRGVRAALIRYRVMAYIVGVGLVILVFVGVPLQYAAGIPQVAGIVGPIHGVMYIVYLVSAVDLARRGQLTTKQLLFVVLAGFVPVVAFVMERKVTRRVREYLESGTPVDGTGSD